MIGKVTKTKKRKKSKKIKSTKFDNIKGKLCIIEQYLDEKEPNLDIESSRPYELCVCRYFITLYRTLSQTVAIGTTK